MQDIIFISKFKENCPTEKSLCDTIKHLILFIKLWIHPREVMCFTAPAGVKQNQQSPSVSFWESWEGTKNVLTFATASNGKWSSPLDGFEESAD